MTIELDFSNDYEVWDNREPITLVSRKNAGDTEVWTAEAKRRAPTFREMQASGGAYTSSDIVWLVPVKFLANTQAKPADKVRDEDGNVWTVLDCSLNTWKTWWRLTTRNLVIAYDLRDLVSIFSPTNAQDAAGSRIPTFAATYSNIPAKIQEQSGDVADERGKRGVRKVFTIYLAEQVVVSNLDQARNVTTGDIYEIRSYRNPSRIDQLMELSVERKF